MGTDRAAVEVDVSARGVIDVIEGLKLEDSGKLFDYRGKELTY